MLDDPTLKKSAVLPLRVTDITKNEHDQLRAALKYLKSLGIIMEGEKLEPISDTVAKVIHKRLKILREEYDLPTLTPSSEDLVE